MGGTVAGATQQRRIPPMPALDWFLGTAALVSLIGGLLLAYQWGQPADGS